MLQIHPSARTTPRSGPKSPAPPSLRVSCPAASGHLNRDSVWRILKAERLNRRRPPVSGQPVRRKGTFRDYGPGFVHIAIKHLPKLETAIGERSKRYLYVAIDCRSRSVHLAVKDDGTERSAIAFLREAAKAFPFRLTHVLTENGSCFTPLWCMGRRSGHIDPYSSPASCDADILEASKFQHWVQHLWGDRH